MHEHVWPVKVVLTGSDLDEDGMLVDFHELESAMRAVLVSLDGRVLNEIEAFATHNPSAELVARHIAKAIEARLPASSVGARLAMVRVGEAPGCYATYRPGLG